MSEPVTEADESTSEFGAGVVICLAKFSEHLWNRWYERLVHANRWMTKSAIERARVEADASLHPHGDSARLIADATSVLNGIRGTEERDLSAAIEMWMNGASDHLYEIDESIAPASLCELASLALEMGHGFTERIWTMDDVWNLRRLWRESCIEIDKLLGVANPDWGQW